MKKHPKIIVILGPTASGKTKLAVSLARQFNGEIISADSRQVYKGMDIGTGKDLAEYGSGKTAVKYHLIDVAQPNRPYDLYKYQKAAYKAILSVLEDGKLPIIVGGTGLYLQAVVDGYVLDKNQPKATKRLNYEKMTLAKVQGLVKQADKNFFERLNNSEKNNKRRLTRYLEILQRSKGIDLSKPRTKKPPFEFLIIGLEIGMGTLRKRIKQRILDRLVNDAMIKEVENLHKAGLSWQRLESFGLEYRFISLYLQKRLTREAMIEKLSIATGQFAKRQMAWFRRWEKQGRIIKWFKATESKKISKELENYLK